MVFRHLRYFIAVVEEGSIARAAARLRIAQPALSRQIQDFEAALGNVVFERTPQGVRLTPVGAALLPRARSILASLEDAIGETRRVHAGESGLVRVAVSPYALAAGRIPRAIARVQEENPCLTFVIHEVQTGSQPALLRNGEIDAGFGIAGSGEVDSLRVESVYADAVRYAILPTSHPLASRRALSVNELRGEPLIHFNRAIARTFPGVFVALDEHGLQVSHELDSVGAVFWHVAAGRGWTLGMGSQVQSPPAGTALVPLLDFRVDIAMAALTRPTDESRLIGRVIAGVRAAAADDGSHRPTVPPPLEVTAEVGRGIELRHLEAIIGVCETGSLSKGAERVGITQSGASRRVTALEELLEVRLLERSGASVIPTIAARTLARRSVEIVEQSQLALRGAALGRSRCRLALVSSKVNESVLLDVLRGIADEAVEVMEMLTAGVEDAVRHGRADLGVYNGFARVDDPGIETLDLVDDAIECALLPASHPLADQPSIRADQLARERFLFFSRSDTPKLFDRVLDELERLGHRPTVDATVTSLRAMRGMVAGALGWTVTLRSHREAPGPGLVAVPIDGMHIWAGTQLMWRRNEQNARTLDVVRAFQAWKDRRRLIAAAS